MTGDGTELDVGRSTGSAMEMSSFVNAPGAANLNPAMNLLSKDPQVMNTLDFGDVGLIDQLDGIPGGMFDWGEFDRTCAISSLLIKLTRSMGQLFRSSERSKYGHGGRLFRPGAAKAISMTLQ